MISIITPAYLDTVEKVEWLSQAIRSIQLQDMTEWELIILNDRSPLSLMIDKPDERIRVFDLVDRVGPAKARNTGAALASYDAIMALDADDLLATKDTLSVMYAAWQRDKSQVIYGDLQRLEKGPDGVFREGRVFHLATYTFELSLNLEGIIPVTALHSKACHVAAGGWKAEVEFGLEDVEYWIAAGKAGFCGYRIPEVVLLYRKHENSRSYALRQTHGQEASMRNVIKTLHSDVYEGRYPVGCCGGKGRPTAETLPAPTGQAVVVAENTALAKFPDEQKIWVQYNGPRQASFSMQGQATRITYKITGVGSKFQVHVDDQMKFKRSGRGKDFFLGVPSPAKENGAEPKPAVELTEDIFSAPEPEVAMVERLDKKALGK